MGLTRQEAFDILQVARGSSEDEIRTAYKRQALQWHPDKHGNSEEATKKFQDISAAYKRLTSNDEFSEIIITPEDMFDLFAQMFFGQRTFGRSNGFFFGEDSSGDDMNDDSDDDCDDYDIEFEEGFTFSYPFPPTTTSKKSKPTVYSYTARRPTASEASKNAEELMKEEERQRKQREKKKAKKKRQKEKKRLEKEMKEKEEEEKRKLAQKKKQEEEEKAKKAARAEEKAKKAAKVVESSESESEADKENIVHSNKIHPSKASKIPDSNSKSSKTPNNLTNEKVSNSAGSGDATSDKNSDLKTTPTKKSSKKESAHNHISPSSDSESEPEETTGLDPTSAFFARAAASASKKINSQPQPKPKKEKEDKNKINGKKKTEDAESVEDIDPVILRSRQTAVKGNEMANLGHYNAAVELFSQAIQLNPRDFRFFGNRSFCYDRLDDYDKALKDAEKAISLAKDWPKGYFRKGRALSGLRLYSEAENAFEQVLKLDKNCEEAVEELRRVRGYQLMEMGFTRPQSEAAIRQYGTVQAALDILLTQGAPSEISSQAFGEDVYLSDEEDYITETIEQSKTDSRNPEGLRSLWVGNVQSTVSEKELRDTFGRYGEIHSLRRLQEKFCCFINFKQAAHASIAMAKLQGHELHGRFLLIKFPDNPIIEGQPRTTILKKKLEQQQQNPPPATAPGAKRTLQQQQQMMAASANEKLTGPVNGDECYFWRTTGCAFGDRCKYKHIGNSKGLDRKSWQKTLYKN